MRMIKRIFSFEPFLLPFYTYKLIKLFVFPNANTLFAIFFRAFLTSIVVLLVYPTMILLAIFYELVELYLKITLCDEFHAMLDGCDRIWVVKNASKNVINALYTLSPNGNPNLPSELRALFIDKYSVIANTHPRFSSVIKSCLGLQYYHKVDLDFFSCVKYMDHYSNVEEFHTLLESYCNKDMPKDDTYLWEIYVGSKMIPWHDGANMYPLLVRYHHSMGDGVSLVTLMTTHLLQDGMEIMRRKCETYKAILQKNNNTNKKSGIVKFLEKKFYYPTLSEPEKPNLLHRGEISGRKHLVFCWEKTEDDYVNKVKRVKNHYQVAFADVISTAISASLCEHFSKHSEIQTENIIAMYPYFLMSTDFNQLVRLNKENIPITKLGNKFAMGFSKIPINLDVEMSNGNNNILKNEENENELIRRLRVVQQTNDRLKNALDFPFCYWQMRMFAGLPLGVGKVLLLANDSSICISNMPGNTTSRLSNDCEVRDTFVFGNNYGQLGVSITLFTYDERFRIGLLVDKSLIAERADAQILGDGIFKYIDAMVATLPSNT